MPSSDRQGGMSQPPPGTIPLHAGMRDMVTGAVCTGRGAAAGGSGAIGAAIAVRLAAPGGQRSLSSCANWAGAYRSPANADAWHLLDRAARRRAGSARPRGAPRPAAAGSSPRRARRCRCPPCPVRAPRRWPGEPPWPRGRRRSCAALRPAWPRRCPSGTGADAPGVGTAVRRLQLPDSSPCESTPYAVIPMPNSRQVSGMPFWMPRLNSDYPICWSVIACTACALRIVAEPTSDRPIPRTYPACASSAMAPIVSSIGTSGSGRAGR